MIIKISDGKENKKYYFVHLPAKNNNYHPVSEMIIYNQSQLSGDTRNQNANYHHDSETEDPDRDRPIENLNYHNEEARNFTGDQIFENFNYSHKPEENDDHQYKFVTNY